MILSMPAGPHPLDAQPGSYAAGSASQLISHLIPNGSPVEHRPPIHDGDHLLIRTDLQKKALTDIPGRRPSLYAVSHAWIRSKPPSGGRGVQDRLTPAFARWLRRAGRESVLLLHSGTTS